MADIVTNALKTLETSSSVGMFARDTGGCLISKLALSRSNDETIETSFAELNESSVFYFSAPILAKMSAKLFSSLYGIPKNEVSKSINQISNVDTDKLKKIKLAKLGQILSVFGIVLPLVYSIAPFRNIITEGRKGKDEFTSVIGLCDKTKEENKKQAKNKALSLIKKTTLAMLSSIGITIGILGLLKFNKFYKVLEPVINKIVKYFEFTESGDLELLHYGALIYPVSILSYFKASRDKYEKQENKRRFMVTVPLMFFGEKLIEKPIHKFFDKRFKTNILTENGILSYKDIMKLPDSIKKQALKTKNCAYALTFFINTMAIAAGIALLNRIKTKRNYEKDHREDIFIKENKKKNIFEQAGFKYVSV